MHNGHAIEIKPVPAYPERRTRTNFHAGYIDEKMADRLAIGRDDRDVIEFHRGIRVRVRSENTGCINNLIRCNAPNSARQEAF